MTAKKHKSQNMSHQHTTMPKHANSSNTQKFKIHNSVQNKQCNQKTSQPQQYLHKIYDYNETVVYKLICSDCNKFYIGQIGRSFTTSYNKHIMTIYHPYIKSNFA